MAPKLKGLQTKEIVYWCLSFNAVPFVLDFRIVLAYSNKNGGL